MKKGTYLGLQFKRAFKLYPSILLVTVIIVMAIAVAGVAMLTSQKENSSVVSVRTGVVGDVEGTYLGIGVEAIKKMDSSRFYIDLVNMTQEEAKKALGNGEITGYVHIPDNFINDITSGEDACLKYVSLDSPAAINKLVEQEVVTVISNLVNTCQTHIYGASDLARAYGVENRREKIQSLNLSYINFVLNREQIYELVLVGVKDNLSFGGYYLCALIIFFLSVWGISCNKLLTEKNLELSRLLKIRGVGTAWQMFAKFLSFLAVTYATILIFAIVFGAVCSGIDTQIAELVGTNVIRAVFFSIKMFPAVAMFVLMHIVLCELLTGVGGILAQFLIAVVLGYISGVFYPNTFFPESVQTVAAHLPFGAAFSYARKLLSCSAHGNDLTLVLGYCTAFFALSVLIRNYKITGDKRI